MNVDERRRGPAVDNLRQGVANEREFFKARLALARDADRFGSEAGEADRRETHKNRGVFWLGFDAYAVRLLDVTPYDRPSDTDKENDTRKVAERRIDLVHRAV